MARTTAGGRVLQHPGGTPLPLNESFDLFRRIDEMRLWCRDTPLREQFRLAALVGRDEDPVVRDEHLPAGGRTWLVPTEQVVEVGGSGADLDVEHPRQPLGVLLERPRTGPRVQNGRSEHVEILVSLPVGAQAWR